MAIHTKVGILTQVPGSSELVTPGLINGLYADFLTKEFDFLDDSRMYPQDAWFTNNPLEYTNNATGDWEDIATNYRAWRDEYTKEENEYWLIRSIRAPFQYKNFVKDTSGYDNPIEYIRLVYPAPNGEFNLPYPNPKWSDGYSYHNSSYPLRHNMTRVTLPLIDLAFATSYISGINWILEPSLSVRDNQAAIDAKLIDFNQAELDYNSKLTEYSILEDGPLGSGWLYGLDGGTNGANAILQTTLAGEAEYQAALPEITEPSTPPLYTQEYVDSVIALHTVYLAAQADFDSKYANMISYWNDVVSPASDLKWETQTELQTLQDASQWVQPDTMEKRNTDYRENRNVYFKLMNEIAISGNRSESFSRAGIATEEDFVIIKDKFLNHDFSVDNPNPWNDERFSFAWGDGQNPVEGAPNYTIQGQIGSSDGNNTMTNHPLGTLPSEVLPGVTSINWLPAVLNTSLLPAIGNPGDVIRVINDEFENVAWDPQNAEWSSGFYYRFLDTFISSMESIRDAKLKAKNELALAMKPFLFAAFHIPSLSLTTSDGNEVKNFSKPVSAE